MVKPEQLPALLERSVEMVYLIAGSEPLLVQECRDQVIKAATARGFAERTVHEVGAKFDWRALTEESGALSLFSTQKILDIRLPGGKPGRDGSAALVAMAEAADPDVLILLSSGRWETAMRKAKWVTVLASAGVLVEIWPVRAQQLPGWIRDRMRRAGLKPDTAAVALLAELAEGNLLAAQQEIDKLLLTGRTGRITEEDISQLVANSARFDAFRLVECVLQGRLDDSLRVAGGLQRTGVAIQLVAGALYRELMLADTVGTALRSGEQESAVFRKLRIWPARQGPMRQALGRLSPFQLGECFRALSLIDRQSKGRAAGEAWQTLDSLLWFMCDPGRGIEV